MKGIPLLVIRKKMQPLILQLVVAAKRAAPFYFNEEVALLTVSPFKCD